MCFLILQDSFNINLLHFTNAHKRTWTFDKRVTTEEVAKMAKRNGKQTSRKVASQASRIMRDGRYGAASKTVAASALAQTKPSGKK